MDQTSKTNRFHRHDHYPQRIAFEDHIYVFDYYLKSRNLYKYKCQFGINRHKKTRCNACIGIPASLSEEDLNEIQVTILCSNHTCTNQIKTVSKIYSEAQIKEKVEKLFLSKPRPTRIQLINQLYEEIRAETPEGAEKQCFSEYLVQSYYSELAKKYKLDDGYNNILQTTRGTSFELFKLKVPDTQTPDKALQIICYCSDFQQSLISSVTHVFIDGTFNIRPPGFEQVLVIMARTFHMNVPIAYFLLPSKTQEIYETAFNMFKLTTKTTFRGSTNYITDFELAELNAVKKCFLQHGDTLQLCYFHFCQAMTRHFQKYKRSEIVNDLFKISKMLPFISETRLHDALKELSKYEETKVFSSYFRENYIKRYKFKDWNISKKSNEIITNNVVESHNNILRRAIGERPSLDDFQTKLAELENRYYQRYWTQKKSQLIKERINEDDFNIKFGKFIAKLKKLHPEKQKKIVHDYYFEDSSEVSENSLDSSNSKNDDSDDSNDLLNISGKNSDNSLDFSEESSDDILLPNESSNEISEIIKEDQEEEDSNPNENHTDIVHDDDLDEIKRFETKSQDVDDDDDDELISIKKAKSRQKANIRALPDKAQRILVQNSVSFNKAIPRSQERSNILRTTYDLIKEIEPDIEMMQIRSWFNNNKTKYS